MQNRIAHGYARVSLESQATDGFSLEAQQAIIRAICTAEGYALARIYVETGVSGSIPLSQRPQGKALLAAVGPGEIIVSIKLDRIFRDVADASSTLAELQRRDVGLYLKDLGGDVTASSVSNLVFNLLASVAQFERRRISERTSEAMTISVAQRRAEGRRLGKIPFGYCVVERCPAGSSEPVQYLEPIEPVHALGRSLRAAGASLRTAAQAFADAGYPCSHMGVRTLFASLAA